MNINNPHELQAFLIGNGLGGICPEAQNFTGCMDILSRMCSCDPQQAKMSRYNQCKQNYVAFASKAHHYSAILLSRTTDQRISFFLNGQLIAGISR